MSAEDTITAAAAGAEGAGGSVVARVKARRAAKRGGRYLDLPVPQFEGDVVVRFNEAAFKVIKQQGRKAALHGFADLLVASCREILLRDDQTGELVTMQDDLNLPRPVRIDGVLADEFDLTATDARGICLQLYGSDTAIVGQGRRLIAWTTGEDLDELEDQEVEDLAGEAPAATSG